MSIIQNIKDLKKKIAAAAERSGREGGAVKIVAVVKNVANELIFQALEAGITDLGENRVQEASERDRSLKGKYPDVTLHFIGHLQRNKVGQALDIFDIIQSVDSERLAVEISRRAERPLPVLIEVNTSSEASKFGISPEEAERLVRFASSQKNLSVQGLMTLGPLTDDPELSRRCFRSLRQLRDRLQGLALPGTDLKYLSMGMSIDFEVAVEEGANLVRIGRFIFGKRS